LKSNFFPLQNKDAEFEELEKRFSYLTHSVAVFCQNIQRLKEHLHETTVSQFNIAENVADLYKEKQLQMREVERFRKAHRHVISTFWNQFVRI
jgi:archaellum component FlaC